MAAKPVISNRFRREAVNLQPYGNTISVTTDSDNPFEDPANVEVYTQLSGGMAGPDPRQRSRKIHTKPTVNRTVQGGRVPMMIANVSAERSFMPGMGDFGDDTPAPSASANILSTIKDLASGTKDVLASRDNAAIAAAKAKQAAAESKTAGIQARMMAAMGQHKGITFTGLAIAGVAVAGALFLFMRKKRR